MPLEAAWEVIMYDKLKNRTLFNMDETIAAGIFEDTEFPWEVLPKIKDFIAELGNRLDMEEYELKGENIWIAKNARVAPTAQITGPCIIGKNTEVRHCAFIMPLLVKTVLLVTLLNLRMYFFLTMCKYHIIIM